MPPRGGGILPAELKLAYALVEQIVELRRDGLCDAIDELDELADLSF